jgi:hypothetical protein
MTKVKTRKRKRNNKDISVGSVKKYNYSDFAVRRAIKTQGSVAINIPKNYSEKLKLVNSSVKIRVLGEKIIISKMR